ncbi:MAG: hypothetical protein RI885_1134 [Actinomycetota bacterium]
MSDPLDDWMTDYLRAWTSNRDGDIRSLFTDDAIYLTAPFDEPRVGVDAIVEGWLADRDDPSDWSFDWQPLVADGGLSTITGETRYTDGRVYSNLWVIGLEADGRASSFMEWYMEHPTDDSRDPQI